MSNAHEARKKTADYLHETEFGFGSDGTWIYLSKARLEPYLHALWEYYPLHYEKVKDTIQALIHDPDISDRTLALIRKPETGDKFGYDFETGVAEIKSTFKQEEIQDAIVHDWEELWKHPVSFRSVVIQVIDADEIVFRIYNASKSVERCDFVNKITVY